jgi:hypothetical protein
VKLAADEPRCPCLQNVEDYKQHVRWRGSRFNQAAIMA